MINEMITHMAKFEYSDEMVARLQEVASAGLTEDTIEALMEELDFPRRSVTAKLRKLGYEVPKKPGAAPVFSADETEALASFLTSNSGNLTAEEIAIAENRKAEAEVELAEKQAIETAKAIAKASAEAKLAALGLTTEEIAAL